MVNIHETSEKNGMNMDHPPVSSNVATTTPPFTSRISLAINPGFAGFQVPCLITRGYTQQKRFAS
jgi:hypothetical protein